MIRNGNALYKRFFVQTRMAVQTKEGFWRKNDEQESDLPSPVPSDVPVDSTFLASLMSVQNRLRSSFQFRDYDGRSKCRLCGQQNGSGEYVTQKFVWPEGYLHYMRVHNVSPNPEFVWYITQLDNATEIPKVSVRQRASS